VFNDVKRKIVLKSLLVWLLLIPIAVLNGALREVIIEPLIGWYAQPVSGTILCFLIFVVCCFFIPRLGNGNRSTYIVIGFIWVLLTIVFEFFLGLVIMGNNLSELLDAYNIMTGNLWVIVLLCTGFSPLLAARNMLNKKL